MTISETVQVVPDYETAGGWVVTWPDGTRRVYPSWAQARRGIEVQARTTQRRTPEATLLTHVGFPDAVYPPGVKPTLVN